MRTRQRDKTHTLGTLLLWRLCLLLYVSTSSRAIAGVSEAQVEVHKLSSRPPSEWRLESGRIQVSERRRYQTCAVCGGICTWSPTPVPLLTESQSHTHTWRGSISRSRPITSAGTDSPRSKVNSGRSALPTVFLI